MVDGTTVQGPLRNMSMMEQIVSLQAANLRGREPERIIMMSIIHLTNAIIKLSLNISDV